ncbi:MAG: hypothetical protein HY282_09095 [Nitrospirae bacterium]|nr:hypothetical protein [Candidatus Manganitrophaceae bacterium]
MIRSRLGQLLSGVVGTFFLLMIIGRSVAHAGGTIKIDDSHSISIGVGLRTSFNMVEDAAPDGKSRSKDFTLNDARIYMSGQLHELITFELNTETEQTGPTTATESIRILDAVVKFGFNDYFNVWVGRFLPPSDRSNLSGPFYLNSWDYPLVALGYPAIFAGRDDGAAIWGMVGKGFFKYQFGAFQGEGAVPGGPNQKDDLLYAGRLTLNLWDPEPGYYNSSTYYGAMNVLALGLVGMTQKNAVGTAATPGDFTGWNVDFLAERNLGAIGVPTFEAAYYHYDNDGVATEGKGYLALVSYLLPMKVGAGAFQGQFQPLVRYQKFKNEGPVTGDHNRVDAELSYIINGHNARISFDYFKDKDKSVTGAPDVDGFRLGLQFQL